ncbi:BQ5605_C041g11962 [Microbotryum silenes-dioicae]|uniref:BQ5605_C041g11962 protein n=1 Tax=Microbotryum silenes-dioicae TaxID=796604 RepID=A0A2X0MR20_9BASI|nr:BQ5605_C041g11962 [Microbotryum silenes-dioicae]
MVSERKNGVQKKKTDKNGLGRAIINRRAKHAKMMADPTLHNSEIAAGLKSVTQENDLDEFLTTAALAETDFAAERQNIKVVADPNLTAASHNPYLLTPQQERELRQKQVDNFQRLQVPRRPPWNRKMTTVELERRERDSFLEWRRGLADLQDNNALLLTPFERNLEVWRQLWRTCERSDLIVQIVDARSPLTFRSEDLEKYVLELNDTNNDSDKSVETAQAQASTSTQAESRPRGERKNLLLINKSDLLTQKQRQGWADYFEANKIQYAFFSAAHGIALQEERARREALVESSDEGSESGTDDTEEVSSDHEDYDPIVEARKQEHVEALAPGMKIPKSGNKLRTLEDVRGPGSSNLGRSPQDEEDSDSEGDDDDGIDELAKRMRSGLEITTEGESPRTRILTVLELEDLFLKHAPKVSVARGFSAERMTVGLVGYPNVGKSSTINALIGEKKVSVSSTPGKTKHFQTIRLSADVLLCDCPGLVFPQFASTQAHLVCDGVLPIDQLREFTGPIALITKRVPQAVLEGTYGLRIPTLPISEGGTGVPTAAEFMTTYAIARGYFTGGMGNADTSRAARVVLKDYVNGKLLYCSPPPSVTEEEFNSENRDVDRLKSRGLLRAKRAPTTRVPVKADTYISQVGEEGAAQAMSKTRQSARAKALDRRFFTSKELVGLPGVRGVAGEKNGASFSRVRMFPHQQGQVDESGNKVPIKKARRVAAKAAKAAAAVEKGQDPSDKKHFKKKREKQRSGRGYDD